VLTYEFEVYADVSLTNLVSESSYIPGDTAEHCMGSHNVPHENTTYFWRARAFDSQLYSPLDAGLPRLWSIRPVMHLERRRFMLLRWRSLSTLAPTLSVFNATDPDSDTLTYDYEIYAQGVLITDVTGVQQGMSGITSTA